MGTRPLILITDGGPARASGRLVESVTAVLEVAGEHIHSIILREQVEGETAFPAATDREVLELGREVLPLTRVCGAKLIVSRRPDIARAIGADGVQIGSRSLEPGVCRDFLGSSAVIGCSVHSVEEARALQAGVVDYVLLAPVAGVKAKHGGAAPLGFEELQRACAGAAVPVYALGGIDDSNAGRACEAGAAGIGVMSFVFGAEDPRDAVRRIVRSLEDGDRIVSAPKSGTAIA